MKWFSIFLILISLPLVAQEKKKVLATASMWEDMCAVIAGNLVDLDVIVPIGSDPHLYEPTPGDLLKVSKADIILINGLTFEGWLSKLIVNSGTKAKQVYITKGINPIQSNIYHNATDPHAWMNVENAIVYAENIYNALSELEPLHREEFYFNFQIYKKQLIELNQYIFKKVQTIPEQQRVLITSHDGFRYFGRQYGLTLEPLQGTSTEADVQSTTLLRVNQVIKERKIPAIFIESTINPKLIEQIQKENKIEIGGKLYADSLGDSLSMAQTYIDMLKHNIDVISIALSKSNQNDKETSKNGNPYIYWFIIGFYVVCFSAIYLINRK